MCWSKHDCSSNILNLVFIFQKHFFYEDDKPCLKFQMSEPYSVCVKIWEE